MSGELLAKQLSTGGDSSVALPSPYLSKSGSAQCYSPQALGIAVKEPTFSDLLTIINKNKWIISCSTLLFYLAAYCYCEVVPKLYTAVATLEIRGYAPVLETTSVESMFKLDTRKELYQRTTIARLGRIGVADQVLFNNPELLSQVNDYLANRKKFDLSKLLVSFGFVEPPPATQKLDQPQTNIEGSDADFKRRALYSTDGSFSVKAQLLANYLGLIDVVQVQDTSLVEVSATTDRPELSQRIANAHSEGFINLLRKERKLNILNNVELLEQQEQDLKTKVSNSERALADYAEKNKVLAVSNAQEGEITMKQISLLTDRLSNAIGARVQAETTLNSITTLGGASASSYLDNQTIKEMLIALKEAEAKYADLNVQFTPEYPAMQQLQARITSLRNEVSNAREQAVAGLRLQIKSQESLEAALTSQIEEQKRFAHEVSQKLVTYNILSRENESLRDLYQNVLRQLKETQVGSANSESNIFITDRAPIPGSPSKPLRGLILAIGVGVGLAIGLTIVFLKELLNKRVETVEDVQSLVGLPSLGVLPSFNNFDTKHRNTALLEGTHESTRAQTSSFGKFIFGAIHLLSAPLRLFKKLARKLFKRRRPESASLGAKTTAYAGPQGTMEKGAIVAKRRLFESEDQHAAMDRSFVTISAPLAVVSEALRLIRTNLVLSSSADSSPKVIMVTSSNSGEGKTTLSSNLAVSLAQASRKTLFLDCDMRQSKVNALFGFPNETSGLVDYLAGQALPAEILHKSSVPNLHVIPAGSSSPNPAELLGSQKMTELMAILSREYDYVIVDCPPVLPVADSLILSHYVSAVVVVVRSNVSQKAALRESVNRLLAVGAKILGTVVNDVLSPKEHYGDSYILSATSFQPKQHYNSPRGGGDGHDGVGRPAAKGSSELQ